MAEWGGWWPFVCCWSCGAHVTDGLHHRWFPPGNSMLPQASYIIYYIIGCGASIDCFIVVTALAAGGFCCRRMQLPSVYSWFDAPFILNIECIFRTANQVNYFNFIARNTNRFECVLSLTPSTIISAVYVSNYTKCLILISTHFLQPYLHSNSKHIFLLAFYTYIHWMQIKNNDWWWSHNVHIDN